MAAPPRVLRVAAVLADRYRAPDVAAFGRIHGAGAEWRMWSGKFRRVRKSLRRDAFWHQVAMLLVAAYYRRSGATNHERAMRAAVERERAALGRIGPAQ